MQEKYLMISMDDERMKKISEVLGNKTCKKIIDFLAENEASEKEISDSLKIPLNTAEYNLKKLLDSGLIEKTKNFFWSKKGKKINIYKLSNKKIVISPKKRVSSSLKSVLPVAILSGVGALIIRQYFILKLSKYSSDSMLASPQKLEAASETARVASENMINFQVSGFWVWFLAGALFALVLISVLKLIEMKGGNK